MEPIAYVNGSFVPLSEAKVSVLDRGFLFADGIYEVAAVLDGKLIDNAKPAAPKKPLPPAKVQAKTVKK